MVDTAEVHAILRASRSPVGTGAIAVMLGAHWAPIAELLAALERKGEVTWQDHGWVASGSAAGSTAPVQTPAGSGASV
jgi:hypothetical protein